MASRMSTGQALLTALAGLTAYRAHLSRDELLAIAGDDPGEAFIAALAVAGRLADELRSREVDPAPLLTGIYEKASELAYS